MSYPCLRFARKLVLTALAASCCVAAAPGKSQTQADSQSREARNEPGKVKHTTVYTNEDLSQLQNRDISVVGNEALPDTTSSGTAELQANPKSRSAKKDPTAVEKYWRDRARELHERLSAVNAKIAIVQENIANAAGHGYDIHVEALDLSLPDLLKEKADLQKQTELLGEEARKADADASWLR
jgi:uncharacterized protein YukE